MSLLLWLVCMLIFDLCCPLLDHMSVESRASEMLGPSLSANTTIKMGALRTLCSVTTGLLPIHL